MKFFAYRYWLNLAACLLVCTSYSIKAVSNQSEPGIIGAVVGEGSTAFTKQQLLSAYIDLIGAPATESNIDKISNRIVALYEESGYYLPEITSAPDQTLPHVIRFKIQEPVLKSFSIEGGGMQVRANAENFLNSLVGSPVYAASLFDYLNQALERELQVTVVLTPRHLPDTVGDFHVEVQLKGATSFDLTVSNAGSDRLGKEMATAELRLTDPLPNLQQFYINTFNTLTTTGFRSIGTGVTLAANKANQFFIDINVSRARLEQDGQADTLFDKQNYSVAWQLQTADEFENSSGFTVALLARDFQQSQLFDGVNEKLRLVDLGFWQYQLYKHHALNWSVNVRQGLDSLGANISGPLADPNTDIDFSGYNGSLRTQIQLWQQWIVNIATLFQYSDDNLPFSQRFAIASNATARAYESGELNGDSGVGVQLEINRWLDSSFLQAQWAPYFYYGVGRVRDNLLRESTNGASIGLGIRGFGQKWSTYLELGKPLIEESVYRTSTPRAQASFSYHF